MSARALSATTSIFRSVFDQPHPSLPQAAEVTEGHYETHRHRCRRTNTDAVLLEDDRIVHAIKTPTTADVTGGIVTARSPGPHPEVARGPIDAW